MYPTTIDTVAAFFICAAASHLTFAVDELCGLERGTNNAKVMGSIPISTNLFFTPAAHGPVPHTRTRGFIAQR